MNIHLWIALAIAVIALCFDVKQFRIPNWLSLAALLLGIGYHTLIAGVSGGMAALLGMVVGFVPMLLLYLCKGIGAGDVKIFAGFGAMLGAKTIITLIALSFIAGGIISIIFIAYRAMLKFSKTQYYYKNALLIETPTNEKLLQLGLVKLHQFPFMLAVAPSMLIIWLFA